MINSGTIDNASGGALTLAANNVQSWNGDFIFTGTDDLNLGTGVVTLGAAPTVTVGGNTLTSGGNIGGAFGLTKAGAGTLTLGGANTYTGATTVNAGTLQAGAATQAFGVGSAVTVAAPGTLDLGGFDETIGSLAGAGTVTNSGAAKTLTAGNATSTVFSGVIQDGAGATGFTKAGAGTLTLSGANTYTGATTVNAGTLKAASGSALGTGAGGVTNNATLDIGSTALNIGGTYTQAAGATLAVVVNGNSSGSIITTNAANIAAASNINVTVAGGYIPNNATFKIVDTGGLGIGAIPGTVSSGGSFITFSDSSSVNDLILTANSIGFSGAATNPNARTVGAVLDAVQNPSGDMLTVLTTLQNSSTSQVSASLNTFSPIADNSIPQVGKRTQDQFVSTVMSQLHPVDIQTTQQDEFGMRSFSGPSPVTGQTGISTGSESGASGLNIWAQGFGSYLRQDPEDFSNGYTATIWGSALGADVPISDNIRVGIAGGLAQEFIKSQVVSARTDVDSYQATVYGCYTKDDIFYINSAISFAYNMYDAFRKVNVVTIDRAATADFNGQQYLGYVEGGYTIQAFNNFRITPLASFEYLHVYTPGYTEDGAGALGLRVNSQDYDIAQTGLGCKVGYLILSKQLNLKILPELKFKWLYDWIGDNQQVTSAFSGGGSPFITTGFTPARSSYDFGAKLSIFTKYNLTLVLDYDLEIQNGFYGHYGYANVETSF